MSDYTPKVGDRVRVTSIDEGEVVIIDDTEFVIRNERVGLLVLGDANVGSYTIERLPDPEPEWQPGGKAVAP